MAIGFIKLHRDITESSMWLEEKFTRGQAWVDLIAFAAFKDSFFYVRGNKVNIARGQVGMSQLTMSKRWKWSRNKVKRFINDLIDEGMVEQQTNSLTTVLTLCNYSRYQDGSFQKEQQMEQQKDTELDGFSQKGAGKDQKTNHQTEQQNSELKPDKQRAAEIGAVSDDTTDDTTEGQQTIQQKDNRRSTLEEVKEGKERKNKNTSVFALKDFNPKVQGLGIPIELWDEYLRTRKSLKAPNSKQAIITLLNKIENLQSQGHCPKLLVSEANSQGWKSVYPPKVQNHATSQRNNPQSSSERIAAAIAAKGIPTF